MKKFFVSKSDANRVAFIKDAVQKIKPSNIYILCENDRASVYSGIDALILPLKELNKAENWITFVNTFNKDSLLVIDNVLKFIFFGDGKKEYLKNISQSINNIIVTDVVPFYTEPSEIFYPFWFLGKSILGYNSYNTFKANHSEEKSDGSIDYSHSFNVLKEKIAEYYMQDYECFFKNRQYVEWQMTENDILAYDAKKQQESADFTNPIKLYNACSEKINLLQTKYNILNEATKTLKNACIVINCLGIYPKMIGKHLENKSLKFLSLHDDFSKYSAFDTIVLAEMPIVKPYNWIYIEANFRDNQSLIQMQLTNNKLEKYFHDKIFNNELRTEIDAAFYSKNV